MSVRTIEDNDDKHDTHDTHANNNHNIATGRKTTPENDKHGIDDMDDDDDDDDEHVKSQQARN